MYFLDSKSASGAEQNEATRPLPLCFTVVQDNIDGVSDDNANNHNIEVSNNSPSFGTLGVTKVVCLHWKVPCEEMRERERESWRVRVRYLNPDMCLVNF